MSIQPVLTAIIFSITYYSKAPKSHEQRERLISPHAHMRRFCTCYIHIRSPYTSRPAKITPSVKIDNRSTPVLSLSMRNFPKSIL